MPNSHPTDPVDLLRRLVDGHGKTTTEILAVQTSLIESVRENTRLIGWLTMKFQEHLTRDHGVSLPELGPEEPTEPGA